MGIVETVLIFLVVIVLLVVSHELGHFFAAKFFGIRVDEFGIGIPPKIFGVQRGETLYTLNALPFGGFVRIFGEESDVDDPRSFSAKGFWPRTFIVAAGVIANLVVAYVIFSFIAWYGTPRYSVMIGDVAPGSPAAIAEFHKGDIVKSFDATTDSHFTIEDFQAYINNTRGKEISITLEREGAERVVRIVPRVSPPAGEGALGVGLGLKESGVDRSPWYRAPIDGAVVTANTLSEFIKGLWFFFQQLFTKGQAPGQVVGPVGIAVIAGDSFRAGARFFLNLIALLSLNLALINILPIPALDGGRILFFVIEKITGRSIPARIANAIHSVFLLLLLGLLFWVTYQDILHIKNL